MAEIFQMCRILSHSVACSRYCKVAGRLVVVRWGGHKWLPIRGILLFL